MSNLKIPLIFLISIRKIPITEKRLIRISRLLLIIGSAFCFLLGLVIIVDEAGIKLFGTNEPPYHWVFISAGITCFIIGCLGITSIFIFFPSNFILPVISSIGMIFVGSLELLLTGDWHVQLDLPILLCGIFLLICLLFLRSIYRQIAQNPRLSFLA